MGNDTTWLGISVQTLQISMLSPSSGWSKITEIIVFDYTENASRKLPLKVVANVPINTVSHPRKLIFKREISHKFKLNVFWCVTYSSLKSKQSF